MTSENVHIFEHVTFLVTGTILWWPVFTPLMERRLTPLASVAYLALAALANGLLGVIFTLASTPFYSGYAHPSDELGALGLIRDQWGLDPITDQKLGGAFMWVLGSIILLGAIVTALGRWYREEVVAQ